MRDGEGVMNELKQIREALDWYADPKCDLQDDVDADGFGKRARLALFRLEAEQAEAAKGARELVILDRQLNTGSPIPSYCLTVDESAELLEQAIQNRIADRLAAQPRKVPRGMVYDLRHAGMDDMSEDFHTRVSSPTDEEIVQEYGFEVKD
jgi:hypothetical protein